MDIVYSENTLSPETLAFFRNQAGWGSTPVEQTEKAIERTLYSVTASVNDQVVGIGRLVGDGALIWYIQDLIVLPDFQGKGIGSSLVRQLQGYAVRNSLENTAVTIGLMSAKGKEAFYEKLGFQTRPNQGQGAGMVMRVQVRHDA